MTTPYEIPLSPMPQQLSIALAGVTYNLNVYWCDPAQCWMLDIADSTETPILTGIPIVTGADLLEPYAYLNFGGQLQVQTDQDTFAVPTYDNLGVNGHLYFVTTP